jgi:hypothetical protein
MDGMQSPACYITGKEGATMNTNQYIKTLFLSFFALLLAACQVAGQVAPAQLSPAETVDAFYTWYLDYIQPGSEQMRNLLVDRAYRESPYLSAAMIERVDALLESFKQQMGGGYDPFLMAQDIPQEIQAQSGAQEDTVIVRKLFGVSWRELQVSLVQHDGVWLIDDISRADK